jgi:hypothetical protein
MCRAMRHRLPDRPLEAAMTTVGESISSPDPSRQTGGVRVNETVLGNRQSFQHQM